jgi:osomolarity two-component system sensor histidine kinase SLN1
VNELRSARLEVVANLKAKELTQALLVFLTATRSLAARVTIANSLAIPQNSPDFNTNWTAASRTFSIVLSTYSDVLFVAVQNTTLERSYLNITSSVGYESLVGDPNAADNTTYVEVLDALGVVAGYNSVQGPPGSIDSLIPVKIRGEVAPSDIAADGLFLGPISVQRAQDNTPIYVASLTVPVFNNTTAVPSTRNTLGYMTVVFNIHALVDVVNETLGLGQSGQVLLIGPNNRLNRWNNQSGEFNISQNTDQFKYILPPANDPRLALTTNAISSFPIVFRAWSDADAQGGVSGVDMDTKDATGTRVAVGYDHCHSWVGFMSLADSGRYSTVNFDPSNSSFLLLAEQSRTEAFAPVYKLRRIVLGTAFGAIGMILLVTYPMAAFSVRPIRRLHEATKLCGRPPEYREEPKERWWLPRMRLLRITGWIDDNVPDCASQSSSGRRDNFRIPQKVPIRKHFITDELTALNATFNAMTEELLEQYEKLEDKVRQRTEELQQQTVLAESANEAKTMFIANVSHELRTPLNGILGMCSLVLEENSLPARSRENLEVVFKSGELLLHLLTDLLTFSKNQVWGAQVKLEPVPFKVQEFVSQIMALFGNQARERRIELTCEVSPTDSMDAMLVGDLNRILQVVIVSFSWVSRKNVISNRCIESRQQCAEVHQ